MHRPPGPCHGWEGGSARRGRPRGGGFCGRSCVLRARGVGAAARNHTARPGSRERGNVGQGRNGDSRTGTHPAALTGTYRNRGAHCPPSSRPQETAGALTWLRWAARTPRSPCARRCPPWSHCSCRGPAPPSGPLGPTSCAPAAPAPVEAPTARSAPSGKGAGRSPAESTSSWRGGTLEDRRAVGVLSVRDRRECSGFLGTAHKGGPIPSHADPQTGCSRKTGLSALFSDSVGSRDFSGPPICDRLKHPGAATAGLDQGILGRRRGGPEA